MFITILEYAIPHSCKFPSFQKKAVAQWRLPFWLYAGFCKTYTYPFGNKYVPDEEQVRTCLERCTYLFDNTYVPVEEDVRTRLGTHTYLFKNVSARRALSHKGVQGGPDIHRIQERYLIKNQNLTLGVLFDPGHSYHR